MFLNTSISQDQIYEEQISKIYDYALNNGKSYDWLDFLCVDEAYLSNTSVCLKFTNDLSKLNEDDQRAFAKSIGKILTEEEVAFDIVNHRSAPPGLRIWAGATVESEDISKLLPWIDWAYQKLINNAGGKNA